MTAVIIGDEVTITGNIISTGKVQVEGSVQGYIFCSNLNICGHGRVSGIVVAENVTVHGRISGSINALSVSLEAGCHAEADICYRALKLDHSGYFEGQSRHSENPFTQAMVHLETFRQDNPPAKLSEQAVKSAQVLVPALPPIADINRHRLERPATATSGQRVRSTGIVALTDHFSTQRSALSG